MGYDIQQYNTTEKLLFLMVSSVDHITGQAGLIPGVSLTVTVSKNGAAFAAPAGAITEIASGWYQVAANAVDANIAGPLILHALGPVMLTLAGVVVGHTVTINGVVFTAAGAPNWPAQVFDQSGGDAADALSLAGAINHAAAQALFLAGGLTVTATPVGAVVTLAIGGPAADALVVTSVGGTITALKVCDPTDEIFDVQSAFAPVVPGAPGIGGPVESRLALALADVKVYLRVTSAVDDGLIGTMITASKQAADSFLGATFREKIPTIALSGVVAGDMVTVDGQTYTCMAAAPVAADREFLIGATDHDTAVNLAALLNSDVEDEDGVPYGVQSATASVVGTVLSLQPETGQRPVTATGDGVRFACTRVLTDQAIPEAVGQGCLRWIAHNYEQRADGVASVGVSGAGSVSWTAPKEALDLWQPYRVYL